MNYNKFYKERFKNPKVTITCKKCGNIKVMKFDEMIAGEIKCDCPDNKKPVMSTYEIFEQIHKEYEAAVESGHASIQECPICKYKSCIPTRFEFHMKAHQHRGEA